MKKNTAVIVLIILIILFVVFSIFTYVNLRTLSTGMEESEPTTEITTIENADL